MISVKNLTKTFGDKVAVSDLSFEVEKGEILGFLGPNGAGKTTTMRILTGFFPPTSGSATIDGVDVCEESLKVREMVGYLPEHVPLYYDMTVREFLGFSARAKNVKRSLRGTAVAKTIERCNLSSVADQLIGTISRGFKQRVGLAQAIVNDPKVLILDEPTVGLDPTQVRDIRKLLRELGQSATVLLSSHILSEVQAMCNRVVIIAEGQVQAMDTPANLTAGMQGESRIDLRVGLPEEDEEQAKEILEALPELKSLTRKDRGMYSLGFDSQDSDAMAARVASAIVSHGWGLHELKSHTLSLEDIFIQLVEEEKR